MTTKKTFVAPTLQEEFSLVAGTLIQVRCVSGQVCGSQEA